MTRAVILAAGQGTRLRPLTDDRPKGMVEVAGKSIIQWQVELFRRCGLDEIAIVTGYRSESVVDLGARRFVNADFDSTNMVESLFCADEFLNGDVLLSYGDIIYSESVLRQAMNVTAPISVVVDLDWEVYFAERFGDPFADAESLVIGPDGRIESIGKRDPSADEVEAQYIGLVKLAPEGVEALREIYGESIRSNRPMGWGRPARQAFMTDLLQEAATRGHRVGAVPIHRGWVEIDTLEDHEIASRVVPSMMGAV